jgi:hypothetical protein
MNPFEAQYEGKPLQNPSALPAYDAPFGMSS